MSLPVDDLIDRRGADLRPMRRLRSPWVRAGLWLSGVVALALVLASIAKVGAIEHRLMAVPDTWVTTLGAAASLGPTAAARTGVVDRGERARRPAALGASRHATGNDVRCQRLRTCIVGLSILAVVMIRRACPLKPNLTAATGGLAVAAAAMLTFFHPHDASAIDLMMHALAVTLMVGANRLLGGWLLGPKLFSDHL